MMLEHGSWKPIAFRVVRWDPQERKNGQPLACCAEILQCETQDDDRSNIVTIGPAALPRASKWCVKPFRSAW